MPAPFATLRMRQWVDSTRGTGIHLTPKQSSVLFVFFVVFIDQAGESLVLPILSRCAHDFDEPISKVGLLFSSTAGAMALSNLWLPMCADRYGRKAALIISLVGSTVGYLGQALAPSFGALLAFRTLQGFFGGVPPVALAYVTDVFAPSERPRYLSGVQATISVSFVAGSVMGGALARFGLRVPFWVAFAISALGLPLGLAYLRDPRELVRDDERSHIERRASERARARDAAEREAAAAPLAGAESEAGLAPPPRGPTTERTSLNPSASDEPPDAAAPSRSPWRSPRCLAVGCISFLNNVCYGGAAVLLPLLVAAPHRDLGDLTPEDASQLAGLMFGAIGVAQALVMTLGFARVNRRLGLLKTCVLGSLVLGSGVGLLPWATCLWAVLPLLGAVAVGNGLARPAYVSYLSSIADKRHVSSTLSLVDLTLNSAMMLGPQLTIVFDHRGARPAFAIAGACALAQAGLALALLSVERKRARERAAAAPLELVAADLAARERRRGLPPDVFLREVQQTLARILEERHYAIEMARAQVIIRELLDSAFPYLAPGGADSVEHMKDVGRLMAGLGHEDWALDTQQRFGLPPLKRDE